MMEVVVGKKSVRWSFIVLAAFLALLLAGCGGAAEPEGTGTPAAEPEQSTPETPADDGEEALAGRIVWSTFGDPVGFNPILHGDSLAQWTWTRVFASLIRLDENLEPFGEIAESWTISDDGLEYTFHLRDDVYFHDGVQLTAADVAYTYNAIKDPDYTGWARADFAALDRVEVIDDYTAKFVLTESFAPFIVNLFVGILPAHLYADQSVADMPESPHNREPVGAGPFKFGRWDAGQHVILEANVDYFAEGPYTAEQWLKIVPDQDVAVASLEAGEIDYLFISGTTRQRIIDEYSDRLNFYDWPRLGTVYMQLNLERPGLSDRRVRQALAYGINQQAIVDDILEGRGVNIHAPLSPASWAYTEEGVTQYIYDPEKAVQLLEEAGYSRG
ncbi:MAG: ABC transporter substrate-binding protein, partial [Thermaerobacterales bacterium]